MSWVWAVMLEKLHALLIWKNFCRVNVKGVDFGCSMTCTPISFMNFNCSLTNQKYWQGESIQAEKFMDSDWVEGFRYSPLISGAEWQDSIRANMFLKLGGDYWRSDAVRNLKELCGNDFLTVVIDILLVHQEKDNSAWWHSQTIFFAGFSPNCSIFKWKRKPNSYDPFQLWQT